MSTAQWRGSSVLYNMSLMRVRQRRKRRSKRDALKGHNPSPAVWFCKSGQQQQAQRFFLSQQHHIMFVQAPAKWWRCIVAVTRTKSRSGPKLWSAPAFLGKWLAPLELPHHVSMVRSRLLSFLTNNCQDLFYMVPVLFCSWCPVLFVVGFTSCLCSSLPSAVIALICFICVLFPSVFKPCLSPLLLPDCICCPCVQDCVLCLIASSVPGLHLFDLGFCVFPVCLVCPSLLWCTAAAGIKELVLCTSPLLLPVPLG